MSDYKPLTPQEIERGYFLLTHRDKIKKIFLVVSVLIIALIYVSLGINIIKYIGGGGFQELAAKMTPDYDWSAYHLERGPQELVVSPAQIVSIGNNRYNLVAFVANPNADWLVKSLDYNFIVNGKALPVSTSLVNAQESAMLLASAYESNTFVSSASVNVDKINWYRRGPEVPDIKWDIQEISFQAISREGQGEDAVVLPASVTWTAQNLSFKNFWQVNWQVALYSGDKLVGAQEIVSQDFLSLEKRDLRAVWLYNLPRVTDVLVLPQAGWLDTENFKYIQGDVDTSGGDDRVNL